MATLRRADVFDLFATQEANLINLPENYVLKYYFFHALSWPQLLSVAHSTTGKLVGYVLAKMEEDDPADRHGHVTSVAVLRQSRKLGLASTLMKLTQAAMEEVFGAEYASLHVRVTNRAAYSLYKNTLSYRIHEVDPEYYADKEDAFNMRTYFHSAKRKVKHAKEEGGAATAAATAGGGGGGEAAEAEASTKEAAAVSATAASVSAAAVGEKEKNEEEGMTSHSRKHRPMSGKVKKTAGDSSLVAEQQQQRQPKQKHSKQKQQQQEEKKTIPPQQQVQQNDV